MKYHPTSLFLCLSLVSAAMAGPLPKDQIASDTKWLLHFDFDEFRSTRVGGFLVNDILQKQVGPALDELKREFQFTLDANKVLNQINSITAYGTDYQSPRNSAVVLFRTHSEVQTAFVGALAGFALAGTNTPAMVEQTQQGDIAFYSVRDKVFLAVLPGKVVVVGRSRDMTQKAADVLAGKSPNLTSSKAFSEFPDVRKTFFFLATAEGFSAETALPPQAKILQMADGARVALGENAERLFIDLALKGRNSDVVTQMHQVVQGLIAFASLGQTENPELAQLIRGIRVSADDKIVRLNVEYPVARAIEQVKENNVNFFIRPAPSGSNDASDSAPEPGAE